MLEARIAKEWAALPIVVYKLKTVRFRDELSGIRPLPFEGSEVAALERWFSDPDIVKYVAQNTPYTEDRNKKVSVSEFISYMLRSPIFAFFRIEHPQLGFIGHASMNGIDLEEMSFERAITIGEKQHWNKGIAGIIGRMILRRGKELGFKIARASTLEENAASRRNLTNHFGEGIVAGERVRFELDLATIE